MPSKKTIIHFTPEFDFLLFGIVTPLKEYRICWHLNTCFELDLEKITDHHFTIAKRRKSLRFSRFYFEQEITKSEFFVLSNKDSGEYLIPDCKQADYLFIVKGQYYTGYKNEMISKMKAIEEAQAIIFLEANELNSKNNLIGYDELSNRK